MTPSLCQIRLIVGATILGTYLVLCWGASARAQAPGIPITSSGLNTQISGPLAVGGTTQYNITGGTRPGGGTNLFHSFGEFGVPTNNIANFLNETALPTSNILARVTGGNVSNIFGAIQTEGFGNANLFLMNPAGLLFGPNATLNVGGMVTFTSADYLRLADNARFSAIPNAAADALLSASPVAAFGFLGPNPGAITVQGSRLTVSEGTGLSLVGGNITIQSGTLEDATVQPAQLSAPGGQLNLASAASPGEILSSSLQTAANVNGQSFTTMGTISISQNSILDVSSNAAGTVRIRGGQLVVDHASISSDTVNADGAPIAIEINVTNAMSLSHADLPALAARTSGTGNAGDILVSSGSLDATFSSSTGSESLVDSHTMGSGHGGNITITTGLLTMNGAPSAPGYFIDSGTGGEGNGGHVSITTGDAQFKSGGINTGDNTFFGTGSGGNLLIRADSLLLETVSFATDSSEARAGALSLEANGLLHITANSFVSTISLLGENPIALKADHLIVEQNSRILAGTVLNAGGDANTTARIVEFREGSSISTQTFGDGDAGSIHLTATESVHLMDDPNSTSASGLYATSIGSPIPGSLGKAGTITVDTPRLEMTNGARINSTTLTAGRGGDVTITASDSVSITGERAFDVPEEIFGLGGTRSSGIYTRTAGSELCAGSCGDAGHVNITTGSLIIQNGGVIDSGTTNNGAGGNVTVVASNTIGLSGTVADGTPGGIFSRTTGTTSDAGSGRNILLKASSTTIQNGAQLSASSTGSGGAGSVTIEGATSPAQSVTIDGAGSGVFTTTSNTGAGGNIFVNANTVTLQNGSTLSAATSGTAPSATGGTITVDTNQLQLLTGGLITAATTGLGTAGSVVINAADSVTVAGQEGFVVPPLSARSRILTSTSASGSGGNVTVSAGGTVSLTGNQSGIFSNTSGTGNAGNIAIVADTLSLNSRAQVQANTLSGSEGIGGNIDAQVRIASLTGNSGISTNTVGPGDAGGIRIHADESITLTDGGINSSSIDSGSGAGNAGPIWLTAPVIALQNGKVISSSQGPGNAGNILLEGTTVSIEANGEGVESTVSAQTEGPGRGGDITIRGLGGLGSRAADVTVAGGSQLLSMTAGDGRAGDIAVATERLDVNTSLVTSATLADGAAGHMVLDASESARITAGAIESVSDGGAGIAGQITITTPTLTVEEGGIISTRSTGPGHAGNITIQGPAGSPASLLTITGVGSGLFSTTSGSGAGGSITANATQITMNTGGTISAASSGSGPGGSVALTAGTLSLATNAKLDSSTTGSGNAGTIQITTTGNSATIAGGSVITSSTTSTGHAGQVVVTTPSLTLDNGTMTTSASGAGNAGGITVNAGTVLVQGGGQLSSSSTGAATGAAGTITVQGLGGTGTLAQSVTLTNGKLLTSAAGSGAGGNIVVRAPSLTLTEGAVISASVKDFNTANPNDGPALGLGNIELTSSSMNITGSAVTAETSGTRTGGSITANAGQLTMSNGGTISTASSGTGAGGNITVNANQSVTLTDSASISASSTGLMNDAGNAGIILVNAGNNFLAENSSVTTKSANAGGGNIEINAIDLIHFINTQINASARLNGGNITIDPNSVILQNSQILAQAVLGNGGNITITTPLYLVDSTSTVSASSQFGRNGTVNIQSPTSNLSGTVSSLPSSMRQSQALQTGRCAALADSQSSSLIVAGRETMPTEPGGWLPSPLTSLSTDADTGLEARGVGQDETGEGRGARGKVEAIQIVSLRRLTPAGFLTQSFAEGGSTGCRS